MAESKSQLISAGQERIANHFIRWMTKANTWVDRGTGGKVGGNFMRGAPVCLITTIDPMKARPVSDEEKAGDWLKLLEIYPGYEGDQARTARTIPLMALSPVS